MILICAGRVVVSLILKHDRHVEMKPAHRGMMGCCPFHEDRTPSFSVDDSRGSYHCFGCGASGDVITFLMQANIDVSQLRLFHLHSLLRLLRGCESLGFVEVLCT